VTSGLLELQVVQSSSQMITTNKPTSSFFTGRMPFLSPNQQCQSTEGKISHSMDLLTPSSSVGLPTLSLTTNSSWLPWGRVAMPLISLLMPVPLTKLIHSTKKIINILRPGLYGDDPLATVRLPQRSLSSQSLGKC